MAAEHKSNFLRKRNLRIGSRILSRLLEQQSPEVLITVHYDPVYITIERISTTWYCEGLIVNPKPLQIILRNLIIGAECLTPCPNFVRVHLVGYTSDRVHSGEELRVMG